jgi:short/branched chain acyl-CoA dehydrogenase
MFLRNGFNLAKLATNNGFKSTLNASTKFLSSSAVNDKSLYNLSDEEAQMKETVARLAKEKIEPFVREMEEKGDVLPEIRDLCFKNGLMGVEIPSEYNGTNSTFFSSCLVVEELAKVDASLAVMVDIQNTLINTLLIQLGTDYLKSRYLPLLATNMVHFA